MYGTRAAANSWAKEYTGKLQQWGFTRGRSTPCVFFHRKRELLAMVHGDDFVSLGPEEQVRWFHSQMEDTYEVKVRAVLGPDDGDDNEIDVQTKKKCCL